MSRSIRRNLLTWLLVSTLVVWLCGILGVSFLARKLTQAAYDDNLVDSARTIASRLEHENDHWQVALSEESIGILLQDPIDHVFFRVFAPDGTTIAGQSDLPLQQINGMTPVTRTIQIANDSVRVAVFPVTLRGSATPAIVEVAETLHGRDQTARQAFTRIVFPLGALLVLALLGTWWTVRRSLAPLQEISDTVARRSPTDLAPLSESGVPDEILPIIRALNTLFGDISLTIESQQRFLANAAHQLRTPLSGVKTQLELLLARITGHDVAEEGARINAGLNSLGRLIRQLLAYAHAEQGENQLQFETLDLSEVVREVATDLAPQALRKSIDLGLVADDSDLLIKGDRGGLSDLASNLIENAMLHMGGAGTITIGIVAEQNEIVLNVDDSGPGIPKSERLKVFERFYRLKNSYYEGTGLGLAIVSEIAQRHKAIVQIENGPGDKGTRVRVAFPRIAPEFAFPLSA